MNPRLLGTGKTPSRLLGVGGPGSIPSEQTPASLFGRAAQGAPTAALPRVSLVFVRPLTWTRRPGRAAQVHSPGSQRIAWEAGREDPDVSRAPWAGAGSVGSEEALARGAGIRGWEERRRGRRRAGGRSAWIAEDAATAASPLLQYLGRHVWILEALACTRGGRGGGAGDGGWVHGLAGRRGRWFPCREISSASDPRVSAIIFTLDSCASAGVGPTSAHRRGVGV